MGGTAHFKWRYQEFEKPNKMPMAILFFEPFFKTRFFDKLLDLGRSTKPNQTNQEGGGREGGSSLWLGEISIQAH